MKKEKLNKIDCASRQIETAIDLSLKNMDSISIHTLAYAAFRIIEDLCGHKNVETQARTFYERLKSTGMESRIAGSCFSNAANFFKHADKDPQKIFEDFEPKFSDLLLFMAIENLRKIEAPISNNMEAYIRWFIIYILGQDESQYNSMGLSLNKAFWDQLSDKAYDYRQELFEMYKKNLENKPDEAFLIFDQICSTIKIKEF